MLLALFVAALGFHAWGVGRGWGSGFLPGNEYRQTHTAISALFIQREDNFSLAYPTPLLGKPWSVPYEFPLYQWTVVGLSNATGWPLIQCGRAVSALCFYLMLPAVWLLLGRVGLGSHRRLLVLAVVLTCPLYIFYARAFLIEMMALMFSAWFLQAYLAAGERRNAGWLAVAALAGTGAGLVKVTTFLLHLAPAAAWTAWWLWLGRRQRAELARRAAWGAAAVALPFAATLAWIRFADGVKAQNLDGRNFMSGPMNAYHFGDWSHRLAAGEWMVHAKTVVGNVAGPLALLVLAAGLLPWAGRARGWILGGLAVFAAGPATFPLLYSWHEYYFAANSLFLLGALGLVLAASWDTRLPRWAAGLVAAVTLASQAAIYVRDFLPVQRVMGSGGSGLTQLLRDVTAPDDVLVIAGQDWLPVVPFYAERRALMFRVHKDTDPSYVTAALERLRGESVRVLLLSGVTRDNSAFRDAVVARFGLEPEPFARAGDTLVYTDAGLRRRLIEQVHAVPYGGVELAPAAVAEGAAVRARIVAFGDLPERQRQVFTGFGPVPVRVSVDYPVDVVPLGDGRVLSAHPHARFWFQAPAGRRTVGVEFGFLPSAHEGVAPEQASDGVDFSVEVEGVDGRRRTVFHRRLDPQRVADDRGRQSARLEVELAAGEHLMLVTGPGPAGSLARDWAYWGGWTIE